MITWTWIRIQRGIHWAVNREATSKKWPYSRCWACKSMKIWESGAHKLQPSSSGHRRDLGISKIIREPLHFFKGLKITL